MKTLLLATVLIASFKAIECSGHMEIRLKSEFAQDLTLLVSEGSNPTVIALPIRVAGQEEKILKTFPLDYSRNYTLRILGGKVKELGLSGSSYVVQFEPIRGTSSPKQLHLPLRGLELVFECDENWAGPKCEVQSGSSTPEALASNVLEVSTDYTVDLEALPKIVDRLKETTKVENEIRTSSETTTIPFEVASSKPHKKTVEDEEDKMLSEFLMEKTEPVRPRKEKGRSSFSELFKSLFSVLENDLGRISSDVPVTIELRGMDDEEEVFPPTPSSFLESFRLRMQKKKEEELKERREGIERHRESQQLLGMRHTTPRGMDVSPFASLPFGPMALMSALGKK